MAEGIPCVQDNMEVDWETPSVQDKRDNEHNFLSRHLLSSLHIPLPCLLENRVRDKQNVSMRG